MSVASCFATSTSKPTSSPSASRAAQGANSVTPTRSVPEFTHLLQVARRGFARERQGCPNDDGCHSQHVLPVPLTAVETYAAWVGSGSKRCAGRRRRCAGHSEYDPACVFCTHRNRSNPPSRPTVTAPPTETKPAATPERPKPTRAQRIVAFTFLGAFGLTMLTVVFTGLYVRSPSARRAPETPAVTLTIGEPRTINLVFAARAPLAGRGVHGRSAGGCRARGPSGPTPRRAQGGA